MSAQYEHRANGDILLSLCCQQLKMLSFIHNCSLKQTGNLVLSPGWPKRLGEASIVERYRSICPIQYSVMDILDRDRNSPSPASGTVIRPGLSPRAQISRYMFSRQAARCQDGNAPRRARYFLSELSGSKKADKEARRQTLKAGLLRTCVHHQLLPSWYLTWHLQKRLSLQAMLPS
jgi:hypothetical protein